MLFCLTFFFCISGWTSADDHGNSWDTATPIPGDGTPTGGVIEVVGDLDYFSFPALDGTSYQFGLTAAADDFLYELYDTNGVSMIDSDDDFMTWQASTNGTYFLEVSEDLGLNTGAYELVVGPYGDDHGNRGMTATHLVTEGAPTSGVIEVFSDSDWFAFSASSGVSYAFSILSDADTFICFINDTNDVHLMEETRYFSWQAPASGTFYAEVRGEDDLTTGDYQLTAAPYDDDHGNYDDTATQLAVDGTPTNGVTEVNNDSDYFSFSAIGGVSYYFTSETSADGHFFEIWDENGESEATWDWSGAWQAPTSGVYYLEVSSEQVGTYELAVTPYDDDHGNWSGTATPIPCDGTPTGGVIEVDEDLDWFSVPVSNTVSYHFRAIQHGDCSVEGALFPPDGDVWEEAGEFTWQAGADETFFIEISSWGCTGSYDFVVGPYSDDHGDGATSTPILADGTPTDGVIEVPHDMDWFSFAASNGVSYRFQLAGGSLGFDDSLYCALFGPEWEYLDGGTEFTWQAPTDATYYVEASGWDIGTYQLVVGPYDDDHGNWHGAATPIPADGIPTSAVIEVAFDSDCFSFSASNGVPYAFSVTANFDSCFCILFDTDGESVVFDGGREPFAWMAPEDGTYYINVKGDEPGTYDLTVGSYEDDHGNEWWNATPIPVNSTPTGGIVEVPGDVDWFSFTASNGVSYAIREVGYDVEFGLVGTDGWSLLDVGDAFAWQAPADSEYYIMMPESDPTFTGAYELVVQSYDDDHGNWWQTATEIPCDGITTSGTIEVESDGDWFRFSVSNGMAYSFSVEGSASNFMCQLMGAPRFGDLPGGEQFIWEPDDDGVFYVAIWGDDETTGTYQFAISSLPVPVPDFLGSPTNISVGGSVTFSDQSQGVVSRWLWDFGDGQTSTNQNPLHVYSRTGWLTVSLSAFNALSSATETKRDYIYCQPPDATYAYDEISQLTEVHVSGAYVAQYRYDCAGNRTSLVVYSNADDRDADGASDYAEVLYNGLTDYDPYHSTANPSGTDLDVADADSDGDGMMDGAEIAAGTRATDSNSVFQVTEIVDIATNSLVIRWSSVSNKLYVVKMSTNLMSGFSVLTSNIPATPVENSYTDVVNDLPVRFYVIETSE